MDENIIKVEQKNLLDFFVTNEDKKTGKEQLVLFADRNGIRCRIALYVGNVWNSCCGFVGVKPDIHKLTFIVHPTRVDEFGVLYVVSKNRNSEGIEIPGRPVTVDYIEDGGVFYYTIIFEKNIIRLPERKNWEK